MGLGQVGTGAWVVCCVGGRGLVFPLAVRARVVISGTWDRAVLLGDTPIATPVLGWPMSVR